MGKRFPVFYLLTNGLFLATETNKNLGWQWVKGVCIYINLLKPIDNTLLSTRFKIQKFWVVPTLRFCFVIIIIIIIIIMFIKV
jgi:hypothetical protein